MITDTALVFEGGGMRAGYTAGVVATLLEEGMEFADVYGISAGAIHAANYIARDAWRARSSFMEFMAAPGVSGWGGFFRGRGYFNAEYIYMKACMPDEPLPYNFPAFLENPARMHIEAYERDTGKTVCWGKDDMPTMMDLMRRVRASTTMPFFMVPAEVDGQVYFDGGLGDSWGIPLEQAKRDGYKKFFVVRTQLREYRKPPEKYPLIAKAICGGHSGVSKRMLDRHEGYNAILDEIDALEASGDAYVFCPHTMLVKNTTLDQGLLGESYRLGYEHARSELHAWRDFL